MAFSIEDVKKLREMTSCGMLDCKQALEESKGDFDKAVDILRKKGKATAEKKSARSTGEGLIDSYIHSNGKVGVLVEVNCETDFVAKNEQFKNFVHEVALQIAATSPRYLNREDVPPAVLKKEKEIIAEQMKDEKKPKDVMEKIIEGKLSKFYEQAVLMDQVYIKDDKLKISDLLSDLIGKTGENTKISRFVRYTLGEGE